MKNYKKLSLFLIPLIITCSLKAQSNEDLFGEKIKPNNFDLLQQNSYLPIEPFVLEAPINPDEYIVGPGDVLAINIGSESGGLLSLTITPECNIIIPTVGTLDLCNLTLSQAKEKIANAVKEKYLQSGISITIIGIRKFRVTVSGQVENPGVAVVSAVDRASDAIKAANIPLEWQAQENQEVDQKEKKEVSTKQIKVALEVKQESSKRHIKLIRKSGETLTVDLLGYEVLGRKERNPYLLEGDVIYVPIFTKNIPTVGIFGAVQQPDVYEFLPGDRVLDIIELAHGLTYNADSANVEISRFNPDHKTTSPIYIDLSTAALKAEIDKNNIPLQIDDRIYVRFIQGYNRKNTVEVKGEIKYPGFFTIEENSTKLSDVIRMAGDFTEFASLKESFIIRRPYEDLFDPEFNRLFELSPSEMTSMEKEYVKMKYRERKGRIEADFVKLFVEGDSAQDVLLKNYDYIEIARASHVVQVSGKVKRPGLIPFEEGEYVDYYIKEAGGYSWNARTRNIRIVRNETGDWIKADTQTKVYMGDLIFVPEKDEIKWGQVVRDFMQTAYVIASFVWMVSQIQGK